MLSGSLVKREISPWRMACLKIDSGYDLTLTTAKDRILFLIIKLLSTWTECQSHKRRSHHLHIILSVNLTIGAWIIPFLSFPQNMVAKSR